MKDPGANRDVSHRSVIVNLLISTLFGPDRAQNVADGAEDYWNDDASNDPFAKLNGLAD